MLDTKFWGEPISIYTDSDAQEDGILTDVSALNGMFNGKVINRATSGTLAAVALDAKQPEMSKTKLKYISENSEFDGDGAEAWGIFNPDPRLGNEKFWLVPNEVGGAKAGADSAIKKRLLLASLIRK